MPFTCIATKQLSDIFFVHIVCNHFRNALLAVRNCIYTVNNLKDNHRICCSEICYKRPKLSQIYIYNNQSNHHNLCACKYWPQLSTTMHIGRGKMVVRQHRFATMSEQIKSRKLFFICTKK